MPLGLKFADIRSSLSQLKEISDLLNNLFCGSNFQMHISLRELKLIFIFTAFIMKNLGGSKQIFQAVESV